MIVEFGDRFKALVNINSKFGLLNGVWIKAVQTDDLQMKAEEFTNIYTADLNNEEFKFEIRKFQAPHFISRWKFKGSHIKRNVNCYL